MDPKDLPAFPVADGGVFISGMTIRDCFAAAVIQGICASGPSKEWSFEMLASEAYKLADAMLKVREE